MEVIHELMSQCGPRSKRRMRRVRTGCGEVGGGKGTNKDQGWASAALGCSGKSPTKLPCTWKLSDSTKLACEHRSFA